MLNGIFRQRINLKSDIPAIVAIYQSGKEIPRISALSIYFMRFVCEI